MLKPVFFFILPSQTYPDAVKVWTHWYMYTLYRSPADHRHHQTSLYYWHPKKFSVLPPGGSSCLTLEFPPTKAEFPLQESQGICYRIRKSQGNLIFFGKRQGKVKEENYYPCKFLTFKKPYACRNVCSWIVYDYQLYIKCYYLHLVLRWFNIANPFYFNLILTKKENFMQ